ncbi:MAG: hypothetical protein K5745_07015 [Saccharofermentans sp.]|nr:hypothetical protein [Saccharofermentans sp.]
MARDTKKIDAKGRFFVPTKQKAALGGDLVVTNSLDTGYLCVYTKENFDNIKAQIMGFNSMNKSVRRIQRHIVSESIDVRVDSQGRITVNSELWENIGAKPGDEICIFGSDDKLDICLKSTYENEDHDLSNIEGLDTLYNVEGL